MVLANSILDVFTNVKIHYDKLSRSHPVDFTFFKQYNIKVLRSKERTTVVDLKKPIRDFFYHSFEPTSEEGPSSVSSKEQCIRVLSQSFSLKWDRLCKVFSENYDLQLREIVSYTSYELFQFHHFLLDLQHFFDPMFEGPDAYSNVILETIKIKEQDWMFDDEDEVIEISVVLEDISFSMMSVRVTLTSTKCLFAI